MPLAPPLSSLHHSRASALIWNGWRDFPVAVHVLSVHFELSAMLSSMLSVTAFVTVVDPSLELVDTPLNY